MEFSVQTLPKPRRDLLNTMVPLHRHFLWLICSSLFSVVATPVQVMLSIQMAQKSRYARNRQ